MRTKPKVSDSVLISASLRHNRDPNPNEISTTLI
jgi:hypothetical protein